MRCKFHIINDIPLINYYSISLFNRSALLGLVFFSKPTSSEKSTLSKNSTSTIFRQTSDEQSKPIKRIINKSK